MSSAYWAVFRAAVTVGGFSVAVKLVAVFKEGLVAYRVGMAPELDAFLLAYAFPSFLLNVLTGSLAAAFVPVYVRLRSSEGEQVAANLAVGLTWVLAGILVATAVVLAPVFSELIRLVASQFDANTMTLATSIVYSLMPVLVLNGLTGFLCGVLNAKQQFAIAAFVPISTPTAVVLALIFFWDDLGIYSMVCGTLGGGFCELLVVGLVARRNGLALFTFPSTWRAYTRKILPEFLAAAGGGLLISATVLVDQAMAAMLAPGSVAALSYGTRVTSVLVGVGSLALATAMLPHMSRLIAENRFPELHDLLKRYAGLIVVVALPITALLMYYSEIIVSLLFERGSFMAADSSLVSDVQLAYAGQIPFYTLAMIAARLISAMQINRFLIVGSGISLVLDVVLNWVLSKSFGIAGIAFATTIVYAGASVFLWSVALVRLKQIST